MRKTWSIVKSIGISSAGLFIFVSPVYADMITPERQQQTFLLAALICLSPIVLSAIAAHYLLSYIKHKNKPKDANI